MKIVDVFGNDVKVVQCPNGGFISTRFVLESDGMGYTMTRTVIPPNGPQHWHYKNHLETCFCVSGVGVLKNLETDEEFQILPGMAYILDKHDDHSFEALEECVLICCFNPPLKGNEIHKKDGSYE